ncbi:Bug family tripartite tricarboxylate transporter substrate binding protein [Bordetella genomosp. 9]|uniref:MFS transporter n=1 Tax=Bordetella genomosp. 9 TaxID=1416803 RepID=A0A1W6Z3I2_9BORD|nr:tripartite tricarboxylate transporter substrate binding protein [Bordetella genomosp. 9]ARP87801.1 MFS transporter [Bordetella genomosp. 9]
MNRTTMRGLAASLLALAASLAQTGPAVAASDSRYPARPVTLVVGYAAGGATDIVARLAAKALTETLGQPFVVENRAGANSNIGAEAVYRAAPDGYTLYVGSIANTINQTLYPDLPYAFDKGFAPIGMLATVPNILVVNPKVPANNVAEYIALARKNPGKVTCASSGAGSSIHMSCEMFKLATGTEILHVPYRGSGPAVTDLMGGQVDSMFDNMPSALPHVRAGKLRALGVTSPQRAPFAPDVPTLSESGVKDFSVQSWFGLVAPKGTPQPVIDRLNEALNQILRSDAIKTAYEKGGFVMPPQPNTPAAFQSWIDEETGKWAKVVKSAEIKVQ